MWYALPLFGNDVIDLKGCQSGNEFSTMSFTKFESSEDFECIHKRDQNIFADKNTRRFLVEY
jgi:hypothetical protein